MEQALASVQSVLQGGVWSVVGARSAVQIAKLAQKDLIYAGSAMGA